MKSVKDTILLMNQLGEAGRPFFFMIDFIKKNGVIHQLHRLTDNGIWIDIPGYKNIETVQQTDDFRFVKHPISYEVYSKAFNKVQKAIERGDTFLVNLTFPTQIKTDLNLEKFFRFSKALFKLKYKDDFVVFSPERFIDISGKTISCYPMKGTIDASIKHAETKLLEDLKEESEHNTIVDLIRNDLSIVAKRVRVEKFRYIDRIQTHEKEILQTSSKISGYLKNDWRSNVGDILFRLLPAGSISGAPKQKTVELIRSSEKDDRGWFTGVFGIFDGNGLDSAVMIRYIEKKGSNFFFRSGGGITYFSDCRREYEELVGKVGLPTF